MPEGILAASTLLDAADTGGGHLPQALTAIGITIATHLAFGRRTLLSMGLGTLTFIALVNLF